MRSGAEPVEAPYTRPRLIFFGLHFAFILAVSCADTFDLIGSGATMLPKTAANYGKKGLSFLSAGIGRHSEAWNPIRQELRAYLNCAGIEAGYSFFAPNVPKSYKVVIELHYPDGHVEGDILGGNAAETDIRFGSLIDQVGETTFDPLREVMMKVLAYSIWQFHPDAISVRAILGSLPFQTLSDFKEGKKRSFEFLETYDFSFAETAHP